MKRILIIILLISLAQEVLSQTFYSRRLNRKWVATGGIGYARSLGDLTNPGSYFDTKLNLEGGLQFRANERINLRANLLLFQLSGSDQEIDAELNTRSRGLSFVSNNAEISLGTTITLFPHSARFRQRKTFNPYISAGVGLLYYNPMAEIPGVAYIPGEPAPVPLANGGKMVSLRQYQTERPNTYSSFAFVIPVGVGVKVKVSDFLDISAEVSNRITFTDYLDDVSGRSYSDPNLFNFAEERDREAYALSNPTGTTSNVRGNPENDDFYLIANIKAEFYLRGDFLDGLFGINGKRLRFNKKSRRGGLFNRGPNRR